MSINRRSFLAASGALAASALMEGRFARAADSRDPVIVGSGEYRYRCLHDWGALPDTIAYGLTHGVAVDKAGNVHVAVGKASFTPQQITENARAVIEAVVKSRPASAKGVFVRSCTLSLTMSPPVRVEMKEFGTR